MIMAFIMPITIKITALVKIIKFMVVVANQGRVETKVRIPVEVKMSIVITKTQNFNY